MAEAKHNQDERRKSFEELARDLECDEDEAAFEAKVRKVAGSAKARSGDYWQIHQVPGGHLARLVTDSPSAPDSPVLPTPEAVREWLLERGCTQTPDDDDKWLNQ